MALAETVSKIDHLSDQQRDCIERCQEATEVCEWCSDACVDEGEGMERCIRLCRDVVDLASLHARFIARDSGYSPELAGICADVCEECADECARHEADHCQVCVDVLRDCADSCRAMSA